ncbi:MAG: carboxymuconolactone decarboxylase family protein [Pseudomonadales bacterium]|nr:carboxymuconolactone decarboxylase family protein [Pseudomonadales bacterium]
MRLAPVEQPAAKAVQDAYSQSLERYGLVISPLKTVTARVPASLPLSEAIVAYLYSGCTLDPSLRLLVQLLVARLNHCDFCIDIASASAVTTGITAEKLAAIETFATSPLFDEKERSALAYVSHATRHKAVPDAVFESLQAHHDDTAIAEITLVLAIEHYFNMINIPLGIEADGFCAMLATPQSPARAAAD